MIKKIKRFQRLATLRKKDLSKEIMNSNLLQDELAKNQDLINQINNIIESGKDNNLKKFVSSGYFKNNTQLLNTLQNQKNIACSRNEYLLNEKRIINKKIITTNLKKNKAEEKFKEYKKSHLIELEKKQNL